MPDFPDIFLEMKNAPVLVGLRNQDITDLFDFGLDAFHLGFHVSHVASQRDHDQDSASYDGCDLNDVSDGDGIVYDHYGPSLLAVGEPLALLLLTGTRRYEISVRLPQRGPVARQSDLGSLALGDGGIRDRLSQ
jgi:hypothetical protein